MKFRSVIRPRSEPEGERREILVDAPSYDDAITEIEAQTPDGWIKVFVMTVAD